MMERRKNKTPIEILDFRFEDNDELEEDYESQIIGRLKTLEPKRQRRHSND